MPRLRRSLGAVAIIAVVGGLVVALDSRAGVQAAGGSPDAAGGRSQATATPARPQQPTADAAASAPLLRQYCVGCHNERMKGNFGNLSLEGLDPSPVSGHTETLEKVVRQIRKVLMPPPGRPRPD